MDPKKRSWTWGLLGGLLVLGPTLGYAELSTRYQVITEAGRLEAVAAEAAAAIDADTHERIQAPQDAVTPAFQRLRRQLLTVQERHDLRSPMYTLRPAADGSAVTTFVVMTNPTPYIGDTYSLRDEMRPSFERGERGATGLYQDEHGAWISGYAPVKAADGSTVALVSADRPSTDITLARRGKRLLALLAAALAGVFTSTLPLLLQARTGPFRALRRLLLGRLSARIGLASSVAVLVAVVAITVQEQRMLRDDLFEQVRGRLAAAAALGAMQLDAEAHQAVAASGDADGADFEQVRDQLRLIQEGAGLTSPIYTLRRDGDLTRFVVMSNETPFVGDTNELRPTVAMVFATGTPGTEGPYADAHGQWMSAWAPVLDADGEVIAVLQVDEDMASIIATFQAHLLESGLTGLLGILIALGAAGWLANGVARPIREVADATLRIEQGDYSIQLSEARDDEVGALARSINRMTRGLAEREQLRNMFGKYMAAQVVRQLLEDGELSLEGELREVTVLLSDIRGYTALTEELGAQEVVALLNEYFGILVDAAVQCEGVIDKFMGDAMLCWFGAPVPQEDHREKGLEAARAMLERLGHWNADRVARGLPAVATGIGLATGCVVVGNIGSPQRLEYTAIGDAVNLASRLCGKAGAGEILVTSTIRDVASVVMEDLGALDVKGVREPVVVHRLTVPVVA